MDPRVAFNKVTAFKSYRKFTQTQFQNHDKTLFDEKMKEPACCVTYIKQGMTQKKGLFQNWSFLCSFLDTCC